MNRDQTSCVIYWRRSNSNGWDDAEAGANNLLGWLRKGGFPPKTLGDKALGDEWDRELADFICCNALYAVWRVRPTKGGAQ